MQKTASSKESHSLFRYSYLLHFPSNVGILNPKITDLPSVTTGLFTTIPSEANISYNSSSAASFTTFDKTNSRLFNNKIR